MVAVGKAFAADVSIVIALDASLSADQNVAAKFVIKKLIRRVSDPSAISLIVFDDVVQQVVPLERSPEGRFAAIEDVLDSSTASYSSSFAAGLERSLSELDGRGAAHLLIFATAALPSPGSEHEMQNREWVTKLLVPQATAQGIAITIITPEPDAYASIIDEGTSQPLHRTLTLGSDASLIDTLAARVEGVPPIPQVVSRDEEMDDENRVPLNDSLPYEVPSPEVVVTTSEVSSEIVDVEHAVDVADPISGFRHYLYLVLAVLVVLLLFMIGLYVWFRRRRREAPPQPSSEMPTASTYLPWESTSRHRYRNRSTESEVDYDRTRIKPGSDTVVWPADKVDK